MLRLPQEITFNYIPKEYMTFTLKLTNIEDYPMIFKIKTNAPKHYLLSSHTGIIQKQASFEKTITMKPVSFNPQNGSLNDVFLVQAIALPRKTDLFTWFNGATFDKVFAQTPKSSVESYKLKVILKLNSDSAIENPESLRESINSADFKSIRGNESGCLDGPDTETLSMSFGNNRLSNTEKNPFESDSSKENLAESQNFSRFFFEDNKGRDKEIEKESQSSREDELLRKSENQKQLLLELSQENTSLKTELLNLKKSTFEGVAKRNQKLKSQNEYQLWHVLLTAVFAMMLGALLGPS